MNRAVFFPEFADKFELIEKGEPLIGNTHPLILSVQKEVVIIILPNSYT